MKTAYTLPSTLTQKIADYLAQRPFAEVYLLLQELIKTIQEQEASPPIDAGSDQVK